MVMDELAIQRNRLLPDVGGVLITVLPGAANKKEGQRLLSPFLTDLDVPYDKSNTFARRFTNFRR